MADNDNRTNELIGCKSIGIRISELTKPRISEIPGTDGVRSLSSGSKWGEPVATNPELGGVTSSLGDIGKTVGESIARRVDDLKVAKPEPEVTPVLPPVPPPDGWREPPGFDEYTIWKEKERKEAEEAEKEARQLEAKLLAAEPVRPGNLSLLGPVVDLGEVLEEPEYGQLPETSEFERIAIRNREDQAVVAISGTANNEIHPELGDQQPVVPPGRDGVIEVLAAKPDQDEATSAAYLKPRHLAFVKEKPDGTMEITSAYRQDGAVVTGNGTEIRLDPTTHSLEMLSQHNGYLCKRVVLDAQLSKITLFNDDKSVDINGNLGTITLYGQDHRPSLVLDGGSGCFQVLYGGMKLFELSEKERGFVLFAENGKPAVRADRKKGDITLMGADLAEYFPARTEIEPGSVVVFRRGFAEPSEKQYDRRVAGVISGANGLKAGVLLDPGQTGREVKRIPVAVAGRVYCKANNSNGRISTGDLLVSSDVRGDAMRIGASVAPGAVFGKALSTVSRKTGMVLVLIGMH